MAQELLIGEKQVKYSLGSYNKFNDVEQWIRLTEGCPHNCPYCYEPQEYKVFEVPKIVRNQVSIMDMNLICKPEALEIIRYLGRQKVDGKVVYYEAICGIDYRFLTTEIAAALREARFQKIRIAWDWFIRDQYKIKDAVEILRRVGYKQPNDIMVYMICNWHIPYSENMQKLDILKVWRVQACDCWYDNQTSPNIIPLYWTEGQIKDFRHRVRHHNQLVNFGIDPEVKLSEEVK
jgi:hypothetical protein